MSEIYFPLDQSELSFTASGGSTVHRSILRSGVRVLTEHVPGAQSASVSFSVAVGSRDETNGHFGSTHFLEHLLFKGSENFGTLDYAKEREHIENIEALYQQHFNETDPEKRKALYAQINAESVKAAEFSVPNEMDRIYKAMGGGMVNAHTWHGGVDNRTQGHRTALHAFYCRRDKPQQQYQKKLLRPEVQASLPPELRDLLALDDPLNDELSTSSAPRSGFLPAPERPRAF
jgi:hypothetical protein